MTLPATKSVSIEEGFPDALYSTTNQPVLDYVKSSSAHSDVADALLSSLQVVGDAQAYVANRSYGGLVVSTKQVVFAFAVGMTTIGYRLPARFREIALRTGAEPPDPRLGPDWVLFQLWKPDWPPIDLKFWTLKAYAGARESTPESS